MTINIAGKMNLTFSVDVGGKVGNKNRNCLWKRNPCFACFIHRYADRIFGPLRIITQKILRQFEGFLKAYATMTKCSFLSFEQTLGGRIMKINIVGIGKKKLNLT